MHAIVSLAQSAPMSVMPRLFIERAAWRRIQTYVRRCAPNEINGFGLLTRVGNDFYLMEPDEVIITEQEVHGGHAEYSGKGRSRLNYRMRQIGRQDDIKLQWHSHVYGDAYASSTDMKAVENYGPQGYDYMFSLVTNVRGDVFARFDMFDPFRVGGEIEVVLYDGYDDDEETAQVDADIAANVTVLKRKPFESYGRKAQPVMETLTDEDYDRLLQIANATNADD